MSESLVNIQWRIAFALALISGYVDSYALLNFGVFTSFMSGNTTTGGTLLGRIHWAAAGHDLLPIPFFVLGVILGTLIPQARPQRPLLPRSLFVAAMLSAGALTGYWKGPEWCSIVLLSMAMGILNTFVTHVGRQNVSLGFVTGDLNNIGRHVALGLQGVQVPDAQGSTDTRWRRAAVLASAWSAFLIGAVLGSATAARLAMWTLLLPAALVLILSAVPSRNISDG